MCGCITPTPHTDRYDELSKVAGMVSQFDAIVKEVDLSATSYESYVNIVTHAGDWLLWGMFLHSFASSQYYQLLHVYILCSMCISCAACLFAVHKRGSDVCGVHTCACTWCVLKG